jgi:hypothetical protein
LATTPDSFEGKRPVAAGQLGQIRELEARFFQLEKDVDVPGNLTIIRPT